MPHAISTWNDLTGHSVAAAFPLLRLLGASDHSAVFLTERAPGRQSAIKLVPAEGAAADRLLKQWERATRLSHPNLLPLYECGQDELFGIRFAYVTMELADDDLSRLDRRLTEQEARDLLDNVLRAITYLREQGFAHGSIQPSNILASGDRLLLSADSARPIGHAATHADDMWALGSVLRQTLGEVPPGLRDIIDGCLDPDPRRRATDGDVAYMLRVGALAPPAKPPVQMPWKHLAIAGASAVVLAGVYYLPSVWPTQEAVADPAPELVAEVSAPQPEPPPVSKQKSQPDPDPPPPPPPAPVAKAERPKAEPAKPEPQPEPEAPPPSAPARQEILRQVLPDVPAPARDTIRGRVVIRVRAFVDSSGTVIVASNQSPNASAYFGNMAVEAAKQWQFAPPPPDGPQSNAWTLEFEFRPNAARPVTVRATPALR